MKKQLVNFVAFCAVIVILSPMAVYAKGYGKHCWQGPPPEAFEVCKEKKAGDTVEFETSRGIQLTATCIKRGDELVAVPERKGRCGQRGVQRGNRPHILFLKAFESCKEKKVGDKVELTTPRGDVISATCKEAPGPLYAVPDNMPIKGSKSE